MPGFDLMKRAFGGAEALGTFELPEIQELGPAEGVSPITEAKLVGPYTEFVPEPPRPEPSPLAFIKEPYYLGKELMAGFADPMISKTLKVLGMPGAEWVLERERESQAYWEPEEPPPYPWMDIPRQALRATGQSLKGAMVGLVAGRSVGPVAGIALAWRLLIGWAASKGGFFAGAQYHDVMEDAVKLAREIDPETGKQRVPEDQIEAFLEDVRPEAGKEALYETLGEVGSDIITAPILGIVGGKVASPMKTALKLAIIRAVKKFLGVEVAQISGEIGTTIGQYHSNEAIGIPQPGLLSQILQTIEVAGLQTAFMYPFGVAAARTVRKTEGAFKEELRRVATESLVDKYKMKPEQADLVAKVVVDQTRKADAAAQAVEDLKTRKKPRAKKAEKAPTVAEKALETILKPEEAAAKPEEVEVPKPETEAKPAEELEPITRKGRVLRRKAALAKEKGEIAPPPPAPAVAPVEGKLDAQFVVMERPLKDGVVDWESKIKTPWVFIPKTNNFVPYNPARHNITNPAEMEAAINPPRTPESEPEAREPLPKREVAFTELRPSEEPNMPHIMVKEPDGTPAVFNPEIHRIINKEEARAAVEAYIPPPEPKRKERVRKRKAVARVEKPPLAIPEGPPIEVSEKSSPDEIVAALDRDRPGLTKHITAMSKKGWSTEDFLNDPDFKADMEGFAKIELWPFIVGAAKEALGVETPTDIWEKMNKETLARLDEDLAAIEKASYEETAQEQDEVVEDELGTEVEAVEKQKEEVIEQIKIQAIEPPPIVESPKVKPTKEMVKNTAWYQTKEEAEAQYTEITRTKLSWESDPYLILHAIRTSINRAYHLNQPVDFGPINKLEDNISAFKDKTTLGEFERLVQDVKSLQAYAVEVQNALGVRSSAQAARGVINYYAWARNPKGQIEQLFVTRPPVGKFTQEWTGKIYKNDKEAAADVRELNRHLPERMGPPLNIEDRKIIYEGILADYLGKGFPPPSSSTASFLSYLLKNRSVLPPDCVTLFDIVLKNPATAEVLKSVPIDFVLYTTSGSAWEFDPNKGPLGTIRALTYGPNERLPEMITHEMVHALTENALTRTEWATPLSNLLYKARQGIPESDRAILAQIRHTAAFYKKPFDLWGFSMGEESREIYYGLLNEHEMLTMAFSNRQFQRYLAKLPATEVSIEGGGPSIWTRFKEIISYIIYGRGLDERSSSLLDEVFEAGYAAMERSSELSLQLAGLPASPKAESARARGSAQRFEKTQHSSVKIAKVLETAPFKGTGEHAGEGVIAQTVFLKKPRPDILALSTWIWDPGFALRNFPEAQKMATKAIDALGTWNYKRSIGFMEIDRIMKPLNEEQQKKATSILKEIESGEVIDLDKLDPKVKTAVVDLRKYFDSYDIRYKDHLREMLLTRLNQTELQIFSDVLINGTNVIEATKKWNKFARNYNQQQRALGTPNRVATTTYARIQRAFENWTEVEQWSIRDYVTHAMRGSIAILDPDGRVISFAESRSEAIEDAAKYLQLNPQVESLTVDSTYRMDQDLPTLVSPRHYRVIKGKIARLVNQEAAALDKGVKDRLKAALPGRAIAIKPRMVWTPFTQEREEVLPGEENIFDILPIYTHLMEKKMALDKYIYYFQKNIHKFNEQPNIKKMLEDQLEAMRGKYSIGDSIVDGVLEKFGFDTDFAYTRATSQARGILTNLKLGYRQIASLINLASGMGHVWVKTSLRHMYEAAKLLRTDEGKAFVKEHAPSLGISLVEGMGGSLTTRLKFYSPLKTFQAPEIPNREMSLMASYLVGLERFNFNKEEAVEFAKRSVDLQEFNYSVAALPKIMRGPTGKTIFQFKPYLVKEIEFIAQLEGPAQWAKYLTMQAVLAGPRGYMIALKSLPFVILLKGEDWLDEMDRWLNANWPRLSRGVFGFFGIDASAPATFQFPERFEDWAGIMVSEIVRFGKQVVAPFLRDEKFLIEDLKKYSRGAVPIWRIWTDIFESMVDSEGWITDDHGRRRYQVESFWDLFKMAGGARPLAHTVQDLEVRIADRLNEKEKAQAHKIVEQIVKRSHRHDVDLLTEEIVEEVAIHAIRPESILNAIKLSKLDPETRLLLETKVARRMEVWQGSLPIREFQRGRMD